MNVQVNILDIRSHVGLLRVLHTFSFICLGKWVRIGQGCVGARQNQYKEVTFTGSSCFVGAVKLVHYWGYVGCHASARSNWGCEAGRTELLMIVTDSMNQILYPSPRLVTYGARGHKEWYTLPGYTSSSRELVFSDFGYPKYLKKGNKLRVWYGEDLYDYTESDNHGKTCMNIYVYSLTI